MNQARSMALLLGLVLGLPSAPARADQFLVDISAHGRLLGLDSGWGGGVDLRLDAGWLPVPELVIGVEAALVLPLQTAGREHSDLAFLGGPVFWLRFGDDSAWGFVKAGVAGTGVVSGGDVSGDMVILGGGGFVVAPRNLPFHFGFELIGDYGVLGRVKIWGIGLGGMLGWVI